MKVSELVNKLNLKVWGTCKGEDIDITGGYTSDLLSDVMGKAQSGDVWITIQSHKNVVAVASLKDLACIILINNAKPEDDMLEQANEENIPVLGTELTAFEVSGLIYNLIK
ncbi:MAG: DRTGG domain-containing protein [Lentimicrobiaceae bacterium]|nr:DRTGG domain-containing protein [Lentimicrobiaceae bacterium]